MSLETELRRLSFIHAARWTVVEDLPGHGRLAAPMLLFESNFNGDWAQYIDAFADGIREHPADWHMLQRLWLDDLAADDARRVLRA